MKRGVALWLGIVLLVIGFWAGVIRFIALFLNADRGRFDGAELAILVLIGVGTVLAMMGASRDER